MFYLTIDTDSAAVRTGSGEEIAQMLTHLAYTLRHHVDPARAEGNVKDSNGNTVGRWELNTNEDAPQVSHGDTFTCERCRSTVPDGQFDPDSGLYDDCTDRNASRVTL